MTYVLHSVRNRDGSINERELRRKGHRVEIINCREGEKMLFSYPDDDDKFVQTTRVIGTMDYPDVLKVFTNNSIYTFRKEASE